MGLTEVAARLHSSPMRRDTPVTEKEFRAALKRAGGSATKAAEALGINRVTVYKLKRRWGVQIRKTVEVT